MSDEEFERANDLLRKYVETRKRGDALLVEGAKTVASAFRKLNDLWADIDFEVAQEIAETPDLAEWNVQMDNWYPEFSAVTE